MRIAGASPEEIAQAVGVHITTVYRALSREMKECNERSRELAEHYRDLELARLDRLQRAIWQMAIGAQGGTPNLQAMDRVLAIMTRRAALLGLDIKRHEISGRDGEPIEVVDAKERLIARLAAIAASERDEGTDSGSPG